MIQDRDNNNIVPTPLSSVEPFQVPPSSSLISPYKDLTRKVYEWFAIPENYSIVHFAVENDMSKDELLEKGKSDDELGKALDYAFSVQEYKVVQGALDGSIDRTVALEMLKTYAGWGKKDGEEGKGTTLALPEGDWILALKQRVHGRQVAGGRDEVLEATYDEGADLDES